MQINPANYKYKTNINNKNNNCLCEQNNSEIYENSSTIMKKGHSNSIYFKENALSNLEDNQYKSNFSNYNSSIKNRMLKNNSEIFYELDYLKTYASWEKHNLDLSDIK